MDGPAHLDRGEELKAGAVESISHPPLSCTPHRENYKLDLEYFLKQVTHVLQVQSGTRLFPFGSSLRVFIAERGSQV